MGVKHLLWIVVAMATGFVSSFLFADVLNLSANLYYVIYFALVIVLFALYIRGTKFDVTSWLKRRLILALILGVLFSAVMAQHVLSRPQTPHLTGTQLLFALFWRGLIYGLIDGLLLTSFPWLVTWRAFDVERKPLLAKVAFAFLAWIFILFTTTAYHIGYSDFRSRKVIDANIGNTIMSIPTLASANPIASPIAHAALHIAAVIHSPETELFLPPHRE